jgi:hypothetical protein
MPQATIVSAELFQVLRSWNRCHGAFYQVSESDLRWNLREQNLVKYDAAEIHGTPVILGEATAEGAVLGILEKGIWVSLYGEIQSGREAGFAAAIEEVARKRGKNRVAIGSDEFHFLPGIPVDERPGQQLVEAFLKQGFSTKACVDYVGSLNGEKCVAYVREVRADAAKRGWALKLVEGAIDQEALGKFMAREFPGRWLREWNFQNTRNDTGRAFWNLLRDETGQVIGFSRLAKRGRLHELSRGWTPGAMRMALSPGSGVRDTDSCLGPIGIAASERGRGAGKVLLGLSIHELCLQGAELLSIDWTDAYNYYTPLAFPAVRKYQSVWKEL